MKKAQLFDTPNVISWITMFVIIFVFLLLFKFCSKPQLQELTGAQIDMIAERQEALNLMALPLTYHGQNVSFGFVVSLGADPAEYERILPLITLILQEQDRALQINYPDRQVSIGIPYRPLKVYDTITVPSASGEPIAVAVMRQGR